MKRLLFMLLVVLNCTAMIQATSIGINFSGAGSGNWGSDGNVVALDPGTVAGLVSQANWNNTEGGVANGSMSDLVDSDGTVTSAAITWADVMGTWDTGNDTSTGNGQLMHGLLDEDGTGATLTVTGLPASLISGGYYVLVYHESSDGDGRPMSLAIGATTLYTKDVAGKYEDSGFVIDAHATLADAQAGNGGNLVIFGGLVDDTFTLTFKGEDFRAPLAGIQIATVPEPMTMSLLSLGGLALIRKRR